MSIKLNYTNFTHACMAIKITAAMAHCLKTGEPVRVTNRRGAEFLLVTIHRDSLGYRFAFHSLYEHEEVGTAILRAQGYWPEASSNTFWALNSATYDLKEHPWVTASRNEAQKAQQERADAIELAQAVKVGATHKLWTVNGVCHYGTVGESWWSGKVKFKAVVHGKLVNVTREFTSCVDMWEAL